MSKSLHKLQIDADYVYKLLSSKYKLEELVARGEVAEDYEYYTLGGADYNDEEYAYKTHLEMESLEGTQLDFDTLLKYLETSTRQAEDDNRVYRGDYGNTPSRTKETYTNGRLSVLYELAELLGLPEDYLESFYDSELGGKHDK